MTTRQYLASFAFMLVTFAAFALADDSGRILVFLAAGFCLVAWELLVGLPEPVRHLLTGSEAHEKTPAEGQGK